ncbi:MAG: hypothetical protein RSB96_00530, partial [Oscillospiraceae bacterium]
TTPDIHSYMAVNSLNYLKGQLDEVRVPLYPFLMDVAKQIFTETFRFNAIILFQICISFIAIIYFYKALTYVLKNKYIVYAITFLYGVSPAIIGWDKAILTESLALSGSVFFIYLMLNYLHRPNIKIIVQSSILILVLIFLRPTFLILLPIFIVFLIAKFILDSSKEEKAIIKKAIIVPIVVSGMVLGYAFLFYNQFGNLSLSNTLFFQNIFMIVQKDYYKNSNDEGLIKIIDEKILEEKGQFQNAIAAIHENRTREEIHEFISYVNSKSLPQIISNNIKTGLRLMDVKLPQNTYYSFNKYEDIFIKQLEVQYYQIDTVWGKVVDLFLRGIANIITFGQVYLIIACGMIAIFYTMIRHKKILWIECGLISVILLTVVSTIIGTYAEYGRTAVCLLPYCYIAIARGIDFVIKKNNKFEV